MARVPRRLAASQRGGTIREGARRRYSQIGQQPSIEDAAATSAAQLDLPPASSPIAKPRGQHPGRRRLPGRREMGVGLKPTQGCARAMLYLVTGATGLVGNNVVRQLLERRQRVRVLVRSTSDPRPLAGLELEIAQGDVATQPLWKRPCKASIG